MSARRLVLLFTSVVVIALSAGFAWMGWNQAVLIATVVGGLAAVAAVGVAVWAALPVARSAASQSPPSDDNTAREKAAVPSQGPTIEQHAEASDQARVYQAGRDQHVTEK